MHTTHNSEINHFANISSLGVILRQADWLISNGWFEEQIRA